MLLSPANIRSSSGQELPLGVQEKRKNCLVPCLFHQYRLLITILFLQSTFKHTDIQIQGIVNSNGILDQATAERWEWLYVAFRCLLKRLIRRELTKLAHVTGMFLWILSTLQFLTRRFVHVIGHSLSVLTF